MSVLEKGKYFAYPWAGLLAPITRKHVRAYFGPPTFSFGGPALKRRKLISVFGNHWLGPNILYVTSGLPFPLSFLRWAKSRGVRILLNQDGIFSPSWYRGDFRQANKRLSAIHALSDYVIYQSRFCFETAHQYLEIPKSQNHEILHNAIDLEKYTPPRNRSAALRILCAGYFYEGKLYALKVIFEAFKKVLQQHPDAELCIAGKIDAPKNKRSSREWLKEIAQPYDIPAQSITCVGAYSQQQAPEIFRSSRLYVHLKNNDPCPSIVIEAMATGLPVVYCKTGGTPELIGDAGTSIDHAAPLDQLDAPPAAVKISDAICTTLRNEEQLSTLAKERAKLFSIREWYNRHRSIMENLLHS